MSNHSILVRQAVRDDISALMSIAAEAPSAAQWSRAAYESSLTTRELPRLVLVAERKRIPTGFLVAKSIGEEWELENIVVSSSTRRAGIAKALLSKLIEAAQVAGGSVIFLEVRASNHPARGLYESLGWVPVGERPGYYENPNEAAILYRLSLQ